MPRSTALVIGASALAAAWLALSTPVQAQRRVEVFRTGGAHLGVSLEDVEKDDVARLKLAEERGALVKEVHKDTPAERAGLKADDVILRFQGETVHSVAQLSRLVRETPPGRTVTLDVSRSGSAQKVTVTLEAREGRFFGRELSELDIPLPPIPPLPPLLGDDDRPGRLVLRDRLRPRRLGIDYQEISGQLARYFKLTEESGILVTSVEEDGPAAKAGVKAGDVILRVDGSGVRDSEDFRRRVERIDPGDEVSLTIQREGKAMDLKVKAGGEARRPRGRTT